MNRILLYPFSLEFKINKSEINATAIYLFCLPPRPQLRFLRLQREIHISTSSEKFRQEEGEIRGQLSGLRKYLRDAIIESFPRHGRTDARDASLFPTRPVAT